MLRCVLKASKYEKQKPESRISPIKGGDDILDTKLSTWLIYVSNFSPCVINISLLRIVETGSTLSNALSNKFWLCRSFLKRTTCHS